MTETISLMTRLFLKAVRLRLTAFPDISTFDTDIHDFHTETKFLTKANCFSSDKHFGTVALCGTIDSSTLNSS